MSQEFLASYEHGVLRPITPLSLPDAAQVLVSGHGANDSHQIQSATNDPLLGIMSDEPDLLDAVVEAAMIDRESHAGRTGL
jgi:predicted DNA-binding antitoxin AbrB/MazE fold protein